MFITALQHNGRSRDSVLSQFQSRLASSRRVAGLVGISIFLTLLHSTGISAAAGDSGNQSTTPKSSAPFIVVSTPEGVDTLYLAEKETGSIYYLTVSNETQIKTESFARFFHSRKYSNPTGLAYRDGKLMVCDQEARALFEIDINAQEASIKRGTPLSEPARVLIEGPPLVKPVGVAISERGLIAVADETLGGIVWCEPNAGVKAVRYGLEYPKLVFDSSDLLVLDHKSGKVFSMAQVFSLEKVESRLTPLPLPAMDGELFNQIEDIAAFNGLYYLAGANQLISFQAHDLNENSKAFYSKKVGPGPLRLGASKYSIYIESSGNSIARDARPTYVNVSFRYDQNKPVESVSSNHQSALLSVYEFLLSRGMLPVREATAGKPNQSLERVLLEEKVWVPEPAVKNDRPNRPTDPVKRRLAVLLCKLNGWPSASAEVRPNTILDKALQPGEKVIIPSVPLKRSLSTSPVHLGGKTVEQHLSDRVYTDQLAQINAEYLYEINAQYKNADSLLSRGHFISAYPPQLDLKPGSVLKFGGSGKQTLVGNVKECGISLDGKEEKKPYYLPRSFFTALPSYKWPRVPGIPSGMEGLSKLGIDEMEVQYEDPQAVSINWDSVVREFDNKEVKDCVALLAGNDSYLVIEAVRVDGAKYKFTRKDGTPRPLKSSERERLNIDPQLESTGDWHLATSKDFYIGYKLLRIANPADPQKWYAANDTTSISDKSYAAIFKEKLGFLNLPLTAWDLDIFVKADDLRGGSELQKLLSNYSGVFLFSKESANAKGSSFHLAFDYWPDEAADEQLRSKCRDLPAIADDDPQKAGLAIQCSDLQQMDEVRANRKKLKDQIHYVAPNPNIVPRPIAVGEAIDSINSLHPDFINDNTIAWLNPKGDKDLEPMALPAAGGSGLASPRIKMFDKTDHGNHVAGLIAGRNGNGVAGLLPNASLFLINTNSVDQLDKSIEMAIARGIYVFNFSFTLPNSTVFDRLKTKMTTTWYKDYLFVAAAGNDGLDLANVVERVPVSWANRIQNIIGVAASDWENNVLGEWLPDPAKPNQKESGSNFNKEFVQIMAPGKQIYSAAKENKYAQATGTSQAAPQVTAAAAFLFAVHEYPSLVKARLIYTTDWFVHLKEKVWGGLLNFERAVFEPDRNLLAGEGTPDKIFEFEPGKSSGTRPVLINVNDGEPYDNREGSASFSRPKTIAFENILRIERLKPGEHRVIYLEELDKDRKQLRVLLNAVLEGTVPCGKLLAWDGAHSSFSTENSCSGEINVALINSYVSKMPPEKVQIFF